MRFLPKSLQRMSRRLRRRKDRGTPESSIGELDSTTAKELEETLAENTDFPLLRGEKLKIYERRMHDLAKIFTRTGTLPDYLLFESPHGDSRGYISASPVESGDAGPSRSLDSAEDLMRSVHNSMKASEHDALKNSHSWRAEDESESESGETVSESTTMDLIPAHVNIRSRSDIFPEGEVASSEELRSVPLSVEDVPMTLARDSVHKDFLTSSTGDNNFNMLTDMYDWAKIGGVYSFTDENSPLPMKVSSFLPLETQTVSLSFDDTAPQKPRIPELEDSFSATEGILFAINGLEAYTGSDHESYKGSLSGLATSPNEIETSGAVLLNHFRSKTSLTDRTCSYAHVRAVSDYPSNVWDDVAPTRLSTNITNISMS